VFEQRALSGIAKCWTAAIFAIPARASLSRDDNLAES